LGLAGGREGFFPGSFIMALLVALPPPARPPPVSCPTAKDPAAKSTMPRTAGRANITLRVVRFLFMMTRTPVYQIIERIGPINLQRLSQTSKRNNDGSLRDGSKIVYSMR
jgi:hypothetical protein